MSVLVYILIGVLLVWHIYGAAIASWHLARSEQLSPWQKKAQHIVAWCLPILGVAIILRGLGPVVRERGPGWVPLLEPLILSSFLLSVSSGTNAVDAGAAWSGPETHHDVPFHGGDDGNVF